MIARILAALLAATGCVVMASPAYALSTPMVDTMKAECQMVDGQMHTIRITMVWNRVIGSDIYEMKFTNMQGQATKFYRGVNRMDPMTYPLPAGTYTLLITVVNVLHEQWRGTGQAQYRNIVIPVAVSSGGKGTGCVFKTPSATGTSGLGASGN